MRMYECTHWRHKATHNPDGNIWNHTRGEWKTNKNKIVVSDRIQHRAIAIRSYIQHATPFSQLNTCVLWRLMYVERFAAAFKWAYNWLCAAAEDGNGELSILCFIVAKQRFVYKMKLIRKDLNSLDCPTVIII